MKVMTTQGPLDLDTLAVSDVVEVVDNARKVATEFRLNDELVRRDVAISMLMPPESAQMTGGSLG